MDEPPAVANDRLPARGEPCASRAAGRPPLDGRWCIVDLAGKGNRIRTVPMPAWAKTAVDDWLAVAGFSTGRVLGAVNKSDRITWQGMSAQSIYEVVEAYGNELGVSLAPHDVRRTFAKLAHKGRAPLEQIKITLGHASIQTTERYLGVEQDLADAPCDHLGVRIRDGRAGRPSTG